MSSMHRTIEGDVLVNHLTGDDWMIDKDLLARHGRTARTLVKEGPVRLTLMAMAAGGVLPSHSTGGPVTIHVTDGELLFKALDRDYPLKTGDVLVLAPGVEHSATSEKGGTFLLTVFHSPSAGSRIPFDNKT
jgi:quercetin dioxygenase-like cupin family protein